MNEARPRGASKPSTEGFSALVEPHLRPLYAYAYRMVAHPEDAKDLVQETLLAAHEHFPSFRGESEFRSWVFTIATRKCIDHLRKRKRWPASAQTEGAQAHLDSPQAMDKISEIAARPGFQYEYREHVAYCFSCVGRSLDPEQAAAVFLRELFEFTNGEAAKILGLSPSTFRHRLTSGRSYMTSTFEGTCALVGKQGVCWQCEALRGHLPTARRGAEPQHLGSARERPGESFSRRLAVVRGTRPGDGTTGELHDYFLRFLSDMFS